VVHSSEGNMVSPMEMCSSEGYVVAHYTDEVAHYGNVVAFREVW
jgi:hypothetical protein